MDQETLKKRVEEYLANGKEAIIPQLSIDCVIFGFHYGQLKVLLLQFVDRPLWMLPGGFIYQDEDVDTAALRILKERTGLEDIFLRQFHTFGKSSRYYPDQMALLTGHLDIDRNLVDWLFNRFVTIGYYALVNFNEVHPRADLFTGIIDWADVRELPEMAMDHGEIIGRALRSLRRDLFTHPVGVNLLPDTFTMPELQRLYETILDRPVDRGNFRKKILKSNILVRLEKVKTGNAHRSPYLYRFDAEQYEESLKEGMKFGF